MSRLTSCGLVAVVVLAAGPAAFAAPYQKGHCQVSVPADWVASKTRIASADKKMWASLLEAPTAAEAVALETSFKATKVSEDGRQVLMVSTASAGRMTNKQFHAITKTTPSCLADVTTPAGPGEAQAQAIAKTVAMKP